MAIVLSPETGLLSAPEKSSKGIVSANCLIVPDLLPGRKVQFRNTTVSGFFRIETAKYSGATFGQQWMASLECKEL